MAFVGDYNLALVQVILDDFRVDGWAETDAATVTPMADLMESTVSADGSHVSVSRINDPRYEVSLKVQRNTAAFRLLYEALQAQNTEAAAGAVSALPFQIFDPIEGTRITERNARFMRAPDLPFAKTTSEAEFKLLLPNPTIVAAPNVATSV